MSSAGPLSRHALSGLVTSLLVVAACQSGGNGGTEPGPSPAISVTLSVTSASVPQGGSTSLQATLTRSGGFTGDVNLTVAGAPAGVTGVLSNIGTSGGVTTATVTIQVGAAVAPGTYQLTVQATGAGVSPASATFTLTVTAVTAGSFSLALNPTAVTVAQSGNGATTVTITRAGGFTGDVALSLQGAPAGVTGAFNPATTAGATSTLTIAATGAAATGTFALTVQGTATGLAPQTAALQVTVTPGGNGGGNVTVDFSLCAADGRPIWVAAQDGDGPWVRVTGTNHAYSFQATAQKVAFAAVTALQGGGFNTAVHLWASTELVAASPVMMCPFGPGTKTVTGTFAGLVAGDFGVVWMGNAEAGVAGGGPLGFAINGVRDGPQDLIAFRFPFAAGSSRRGIIRRDLNVAHQGSVGTLDFDGAESFAAATAMVTVAGAAPGESINQVMGYYAGAECHFHLLNPGFTLETSPFTTYGIPAAQQRPTDRHSLAVTAGVMDGFSVVATRSVMDFFHTLGNRTATLGSALAVPTLTSLTAPYRRIQAAFPLPADYDAATLTYTGNQRSIVLLGTPGWVAGAPNVVLAVPDFSGVTGWENMWAPPAGQVTWSTGANRTTFTTLNLCQDGKVTQAQRIGTF